MPRSRKATTSSAPARSSTCRSARACWAASSMASAIRSTARGRSSAISAYAAGQELINKPEDGAKLNVLRWSRFVQGEEDQRLANTKKFTEQHGGPVKTDNAGFRELRPKAGENG